MTIDPDEGLLARNMIDAHGRPQPSREDMPGRRAGGAAGAGAVVD
jgi:hypothetical protein